MILESDYESRLSLLRMIIQKTKIKTKGIKMKLKKIIAIVMLIAATSLSFGAKTPHYSHVETPCEKWDAVGTADISVGGGVVIVYSYSTGTIRDCKVGGEYVCNMWACNAK